MPVYSVHGRHVCTFTYGNGDMCGLPGELYRVKIESKDVGDGETLCDYHAEGLPDYYYKVIWIEAAHSSILQSMGAAMNTETVIASFEGPYRFLSNFWPCEVYLEGIPYPSVEHAYQASKTKELHQRHQIRMATTPGVAKRLGRVVTMDPTFEERKIEVMRGLVQQKFQHPKLCQWLIDTGDKVLIEGNTWGDTFWGVTLEGGGQNHLGIILMDIRSRIRSVQIDDLRLVIPMSTERIMLDNQTTKEVHLKDGRTLRVHPPTRRPLPGTTVVMIEVGPSEPFQNPE